MSLFKFIKLGRFHSVRTKISFSTILPIFHSPNVIPNKPLQKDELELYSCLKEILPSPSIKKDTQPQNGLCLLSKQGQKIQMAMQNPHTESIYNVPFSYRDGNHKQLLLCTERVRSQTRVALLCTGASKGAGKSTQQVINLTEFSKLVKGIAIETTFNDDQADLWENNLNSKSDFQKAIAVRIIHRLVDYFTNMEIADDELQDNQPLLLKVLSLRSPIKSSLRIVRRVFGAPSDTKIMLGVDELARVQSTTNLSHSEMLSTMCQIMDKDEELYLTVSAYGCIDLAKFTTGSNRPLLFQPLGPLMLEPSNDQINLLPPLLQPFFVETRRKSLPFNVESLAVYSRISKLLMATGGHARRVQNLYKELNLFDELIMDDSNFVKALKGFLDANEKSIMVRLDYAAELPTKILISIEDFESLARDTSSKFKFPKNDFVNYHQTFLSGTQSCYCQFVSDGLPLDQSTEGFAFIPPPILSLLPQYVNNKEAGPCTEALALLANSINDYSNLTFPAGKALEGVALYSLLLALRSNDVFDLRSVCDPDSVLSGEGFDAKLMGGGNSVDLWTDITIFARSSTLHASNLKPKVMQLVERLIKSERNGALFRPTDQFNMGGDVYCLCQTTTKDHFVLVIIQAKDWFLDKSFDFSKKVTVTLQEMFSKTQSEFPDIDFPDGSMQLQIGARTVHVSRRFVLFCSNKPESEQSLANTLRPDAAVVSLQDMKFWLPTARYSCQLSNKMRKIFPSATSLNLK